MAQYGFTSGGTLSYTGAAGGNYAYTAPRPPQFTQQAAPQAPAAKPAAPAPQPAKPAVGPTKPAGTAVTGYDAAVYAAATSYLASKSSGSTSEWLGFKKGGRTGYVSKPKGGPGNAGQMHYCEVCKISCAGPMTYKEHLEGQRHKKKEAQVKTDGGLANLNMSKGRVAFRCDLCQVTCTGQDTYNAHVRGSKHQKTYKLHQALGKPIPKDATVIAPAGSGSKSASILPQTPFVGGTELKSTAQGVLTEMRTSGGTIKVDAATAALLAADMADPVGEDYIERMTDTKIGIFYCKLCDCRFNDANAKDMHLKGKRHRFAYKKKVDPSLDVDLKPTGPRNRRQYDFQMRQEAHRLRQQELWSQRAGTLGAYTVPGMAPPPAATGFAPQRYPARNEETMDDRHVAAKHKLIYPNDDDLQTVQQMVMCLEKSLKLVSDQLAEKEKAAAEANASNGAATGVPERMLKGVMRVGLLAKGLMIKGDRNVDLVVMCSRKPTVHTLRDVFEMMQEHIKKFSDGKEYKYDMRPAACAIHVSTCTEPKFTARCTFTCVLFREPVASAGVALIDGRPPPDADVLDRTKCLQALAELRHAKWFQARCSQLQSCLVVMRLMRDVCQRIPTWSPLNNWSLQLLVEKVLTSAGQPLSPGDALRRVFEAVAAGVLLPGGPGLQDPCEKETIDAAAKLTAQQREDITSSAQHALRLIAYNQLYKILSIPRIPDKITKVRKRPAAAPAAAAPNKVSKTDEKNGK